MAAEFGQLSLDVGPRTPKYNLTNMKTVNLGIVRQVIGLTDLTLCAPGPY